MTGQFVAILTCFVLSCCSKPASSVVSVPTSTPVEHRFAPAGIYFATEYMSVRSSDGVTGIPPGTRLQLVKDMGEIVRVTTGQLEFDAKKFQLTNDIDIATQVSRQDVTAQQQIANARAEAGTAIQVIQASYGYGDRSIDVTQQVRGSVSAGRTTIRAGNDLAGTDPAPGKTKTLTIGYTAGGRAPVTVTAREGESITLSFTAEREEPRHQPERNRSAKAHTAPSPWNNPLDRGSYNRTQDVKYTDSSGRTYWIDVRGQKHYDP
jgi:hypothetical protein